MAGVHLLQIDQGATLDRLFTWKRSDGTPIDVTGWSARMQVRDKVGGTLQASFTTDDGSIVLGGVAGTIRLKATAEITTGWTWRSGVYDLELVDPTGQVTRLLQGTAIVSPEVTV